MRMNRILDKLKCFIGWHDWRWKLGILIPITVTEPCCENCQCASWDDFPQTCYRLADWMQNEAALQEPKQ